MVVNRSRVLADKVDGAGTRYFSVRDSDLAGKTPAQVTQRLTPTAVTPQQNVKTLDIVVALDRPLFVTTTGKAPFAIGTAILDGKVKDLQVNSNINLREVKITGRTRGTNMTMQQRFITNMMLGLPSLPRCRRGRATRRWRRRCEDAPLPRPVEVRRPVDDAIARFGQIVLAYGIPMGYGPITIEIDFLGNISMNDKYPNDIGQYARDVLAKAGVFPPSAPCRKPRLPKVHRGSYCRSCCGIAGRRRSPTSDWWV